MSIIIYGASDDLIEIDGEIREEFSLHLDEPEDSALLFVSDGTVIRINYDCDGIWRLTRLVSGAARFEKGEGNVEADTPDIVTLSGIRINWVCLARDCEFRRYHE